MTMTLEELSAVVEKLQYHVSILSDCVDYERYPVERLILSMNWDDAQLNRAHDIFQKYDELLTNEEDVNWMAFEHELRDEFNIGYQTVKHIVLAFFNNHQWVEVCHGYAMSFEPTTPVEFHQITRR
ncbi:hypothetical protein MZJ28_001405 [Vibrio parahaemolyticus]|uniref:hypothetical protein n=1 Tax=Vibrio parahaemolyticus TaxID=670 RepID=UPI00113215F2|nr:hypothetical protein [Vibrio parahaemolyticus]EGQ8136984.1 hypothetical protein [Vibrio parahaemolyticus]EGQ8148782.1 hypothetical protein [Vibrio parahaemolyticus]EGQ8250627.1 hypothetical protein [Vibrio parahaemolyticus]EGQ8270706.1 hypothetical protein [Vibrio parahaemolyticus]EGQ8318545.1 hypothetical protein [Vibrio parahaemolyticus]